MFEEQTDKGSFGKGVIIAGGVNLGVLVVGIVTLMVGIGMIILAGFAVLQIGWLFPFYLKFSGRGESETCKGILLGGGISALLSVACWYNLNLGPMH